MTNLESNFFNSSHCACMSPFWLNEPVRTSLRNDTEHMPYSSHMTWGSTVNIPSTILNYSIVFDTRNKGEQWELLLESSRKALLFCCRCNSYIFLLLLLPRTLRSKVSILAARKTSNFAQVLGLLLALSRKINILFTSTLLMSTTLRSFPNLPLSEIIP